MSLNKTKNSVLSVILVAMLSMFVLVERFQYNIALLNN